MTLFGICAHSVSNALLFFDTIIQKDIDFLGAGLREKESSRDVVSEADYAIQRIVLNEIKESTYPIISEEKDNDLRHLKTSEYCWVLDPIDGTANFSAHIPFFGVSLGVLHHGKPFAGSFGMPRTKELFYMIDENVAYLNEKKLERWDAKVENSLIGTSFSSYRLGSPQERENEFRLFGHINDRSRGALRLGSAAANICYAAAGKLGCAFGHRNRIWDVAAAIAIAGAAGCDVHMTETSEDGYVSFLVGSSNVVNELHDEIEERLGIELQQEHE